MIILILCFIILILICIILQSKTNSCRTNCKNCNCKNCKCKYHAEEYYTDKNLKNVMNTTEEPLSDEMSMQTVQDSNDLILTFLKDALENNRNLLKSMTIIGNVPTILDFKSKFYRNNISLLCCNLILLSYNISNISYQRDTKPVLDLLNNRFNNNINNSPILPGAVIKKILVYTCKSNSIPYNSYGGFICEYTVGNIKSAFIVLRGTSFLCELYIDVLQLLVKPSWIKTEGVSVHTGFNSAYSVYNNVNVSTLRDQILSYLFPESNRPIIQNLYITGHSLGASLCALITADLAINYPAIRLITKTYAIAVPYTGNASFVELITTNTSKIILPHITSTYTGFFNVGNNLDPVFTTGLPFYRRIPKQLFCFSTFRINPHSIALYAENIRKNPQWEKDAETNASCGLVCS